MDTLPTPAARLAVHQCAGTPRHVAPESLASGVALQHALHRISCKDTTGEVPVAEVVAAARAPVLGTAGAAGLDLFPHTIAPSKRNPERVVHIGTGVWLVDAPAGCMLSIRDRSSLGDAGIKVQGGVVDSDYRGEIKVMLALDGTQHSANALADALRRGSAVAQLVAHTTTTHAVVMETVSEAGDAWLTTPATATAATIPRGASGWGSTDAAAHC